MQQCARLTWGFWRHFFWPLPRVFALLLFAQRPAGPPSCHLCLLRIMAWGNVTESVCWWFQYEPNIAQVNSKNPTVAELIRTGMLRHGGMQQVSWLALEPNWQLELLCSPASSHATSKSKFVVGLCGIYGMGQGTPLLLSVSCWLLVKMPFIPATSVSQIWSLFNFLLCWSGRGFFGFHGIWVAEFSNCSLL